MNRRRFLAAIAATTGATALSAARPARRNSSIPIGQSTDQFDRVLDMVDDMGCDASGSEPCDAALSAAADDGHLLVFPEGAYRFDSPAALLGLTDFGVVGRGDATFVAPPDHSGPWLTIDRGRGLLFENIRVDVTAGNTAPTIQLGVTDGLVVRDVEVVGRGTRAASRSEDGGANPPVGNALNPVVRSPDGEGVVERFVARRGGHIGAYNGGRGRVGIFVGRSHRGRLRLVDCRLEEFPNNGVYASRTPGTVQVEGGTFANNDISQVRLGSDGSYVDGATIVVDPASASPPTRPGAYLNPRGIQLGGGPLAVGGAEVRGSSVVVRTDAQTAGIDVSPSGGRFTVRETEIFVRSGPSSGIVAKSPTGGSHPPPPKPHHGLVEDVAISGPTGWGHALQLIDRPGSELRDVTITHVRGERGGVRLIRSPGTHLDRCAIGTSGYPVTVLTSPAPTAPNCLLTVSEPRRLETTGAVSRSTVTLASESGQKSTDYCVRLPREAAVDAGTEVAFALTGIEHGDLVGAILNARSG